VIPLCAAMGWEGGRGIRFDSVQRRGLVLTFNRQYLSSCCRHLWEPIVQWSIETSLGKAATRENIFYPFAVSGTWNQAASVVVEWQGSERGKVKYA
jgi:hypothetical protein